MGHVRPSHSRTTEYSALPYTMAEMTSLICTDVSSCRHGLSTDLVVSHRLQSGWEGCRGPSGTPVSASTRTCYLHSMLVDQLMYMFANYKLVHVDFFFIKMSINYMHGCLCLWSHIFNITLVGSLACNYIHIFRLGRIYLCACLLLRE